MNCKLFENYFPSQVEAVFTDRMCDFILPPQAQGLLLEQKEFLRRTYQIVPEKIFTIRQVHGDKVLIVGQNDLPQQGLLPEADGAVTNVQGIVLSVRTADCLPVFLYDPKKKSIALVHAGWKSSALGIVKKALEALAQNYGSVASDVLAAFGPAIGRCCYEVGQEFEKIFPDEIFYRNSRRYLDLPLVNKNQMFSLGVKPENILSNVSCTACGKEFFSYRRDKEKAGRHLSLLTVE